MRHKAYVVTVNGKYQEREGVMFHRTRETADVMCDDIKEEYRQSFNDGWLTLVQFKLARIRIEVSEPFELDN